MSTPDMGIGAERLDRRTFLGAAAGAAVLTAASLKGLTRHAPATKYKGTIAFDQPDTNNPVVVPLFAGARAEGKKLGYKVIFDNEELSASKQVSDIETWLAEGVNGMTVLPLSNNGMGPLAEKARKQGCAFVGYAGTIPGEAGTIEWNNAQGGHLLGVNAGQWVNKTLGGKAEVAYLTAPFLLTGRQRIGDTNHWLRKTAPGIKVVEQIEAIDDAQAYKATQTILAAHPNLNMVICISDDGCQGVQEAFKQTGRNPATFYTAGMDGTKNALEQLLNPKSVVRAVCALDLFSIGEAAVWVPANILEKKTPTSYLAPYTFVTQAPADRATIKRLIANYGK